MRRAVGRPDVATLVRAYVDDNLSIPALAVQFGVAPQTVHSWLVAAGVPRRHHAVAPRGDVDDDEIRRLYCDEHRSGAEISNLLGCSASLVYFRLARLGIERRAPVAARRVPLTPSSPTCTPSAGSASEISARRTASAPRRCGDG